VAERDSPFVGRWIIDLKRIFLSERSHVIIVIPSVNHDLATTESHGDVIVPGLVKRARELPSIGEGIIDL
jgi:hypothetical protein